jgi:hypothetical protein
MLLPMEWYDENGFARHVADGIAAVGREAGRDPAASGRNRSVRLIGAGDCLNRRRRA